MPNADPSVVSNRAKTRGVSQVGTLGSGNHYVEVQVVDEIYDREAATVMGITGVGQVKREREREGVSPLVREGERARDRSQNRRGQEGEGDW